MNIFIRADKVKNLNIEVVKKIFEEEELYKEYMHRVCRLYAKDTISLQRKITTILNDLDEIKDKFDYNDKVNIACRLLQVIEDTEFKMFRNAIYSDKELDNIRDAINSIRKSPTEETFNNYSKCLVDNYISATPLKQREEKEFYLLKCELIDKIAELLL